MSVICPGCAGGEHVLPVPEALGDVVAAAVDPSAAAHLAPPPAPQPGPVRDSAAVAVLVVLAALWLLLGVLSLLRPRPDLDRYGDAYRAGYLLGGLVGPAVLTGAALVVRMLSRRRARRREEELLRGRQARWQHLVARWRSGWWCRRCQAAFFPVGALHPGAPPSPLLAARHYPAWVLGTPAPATATATGSGSALSPGPGRQGAGGQALS
ncbi:hypothetical protein BOQ63_007705 [Streptomyces viridifaciens]|nr:hypothetical protein CP971_00880 [Streptomyces viridifaciens]UKZ03944.1 hypothetical protein BOQ63_007705 [Streptomyces viridifaciens]